MLSDTPSFRQSSGTFVEPTAGDALTVAYGDHLAGSPEEPAGQVGSGRKILIVQGDWEAGMSLLALDLKDAGHEVGKVFFCAPDVIYRFRGIHTHMYRKPLEEFEAWLRELVAAEGYDTFFLYNHYRPYNQIAWNLAEELDLGCFVFELGLIRPNCVMVFSRESTPLLAISKAWDELLAGAPPPPRSRLLRNSARSAHPPSWSCFVQTSSSAGSLRPFSPISWISGI